MSEPENYQKIKRHKTEEAYPSFNYVHLKAAIEDLFVPMTKKCFNIHRRDKHIKNFNFFISPEGALGYVLKKVMRDHGISEEETSLVKKTIQKIMPKDVCFWSSNRYEGPCYFISRGLEVMAQVATDIEELNFNESYPLLERINYAVDPEADDYRPTVEEAEAMLKELGHHVYMDDYGVRMFVLKENK